jgi:hypothetical protein
MESKEQPFKCAGCGAESLDLVNPCNCVTGIGFRFINGKMETKLFQPRNPSNKNFENWAKLGSEPYDLLRLPNGFYADGDTQSALYGWQGCEAICKATLIKARVALESCQEEDTPRSYEHSTVKYYNDNDVEQALSSINEVLGGEGGKS